MGAAAAPEKEKDQLLQPSPLQRGVEAAKAALASGAQPAELEEPAIGEPGTTVKPGEQPAAPTPDEGDEGEGEAAPEGEQPEGEEAPEGEAGAEGEAEGEGAEPIVVTLPETRRGQAPIELEVEDQEAADAILALAKGNMRRDEFNRGMEDVQQRREEMAQLEDVLTLDPVSFIVERVRPELQAQVAIHLLAQPGVYEAVSRAYTNEDGSEADREKVNLKLRNERLEQRGESSGEIALRSDARTQGRMIANAVERMIPEDVNDDEAASLRDDLLRDLRDYVEQNNVGSLRAEQLPDILERRLRQYGVNPDEALAAVSANAPATIRPRSPGRSAAGGPPEGASARSTGQKFKEGAEVRRRAAAVPGAGAGASPTRVALPTGQKIADRVKSLREMFKISKR